MVFNGGLMVSMMEDIMSEVNYVEYVLRGHRMYWDMLGEIRGNTNHKGLLCYLTGDLYYNYSIRLEGPDYDKQVSDIINRIKNKEIPDNLLILPDSAPAGVDLYSILMKTGLFKNDGESIGMSKVLDVTASFQKPDKRLNIYHVNDINHLKMSGAVLNSAFCYDIFSYEHYLDIYNTYNTCFHIAEYDGLPVGACMSILGNDFVNIAWVGTLSGYRKKGIAGCVINAAEKHAIQNGKRVSVLTAYESAVNAYKRIGYDGCCSIKSIIFKMNEQ